MRTVEEIKSDIAIARANGNEKWAEILEENIRAYCTANIPLDRLETICAAEKDGKLYTSHDVAVILADAFGDDCACNINGNDEWLPQLCELQEACPHPVGVACWEQYLKHRDEAEKVLGKEAQA